MKKIPQGFLEVEPDISKIWKWLEPNTRKFWDEVQESLTDSLIIPVYQDQSFDQGFYANIQLKTMDSEFKRNTGYSTIILLCINKQDGQPYDVAHELAHIAAGTMYGYKLLKKVAQPPFNMIMKKRVFDILLVYNTTIHPVVDYISKKHNTFSEEFYQRKLTDIFAGLNRVAYQFKTSENPVINDYYYIIEGKQRLPKDMYEQVVDHSKKLGLDSFISFAQELPIFKFDYKNHSKFDDALFKTYKKLGIDTKRPHLFEFTNEKIF